MAQKSEVKTPWLQLIILLIFFLAVFSGAAMLLGFFFRIGWSLSGG